VSNVRLRLGRPKSNRWNKGADWSSRLLSEDDGKRHCLRMGNLLGLGTVLVLGVGPFELVDEGADADVLLGPFGRF